MTYIILYEEESQGLKGPKKISTRWPTRCHVTRHVYIAELKETAQAPPLLTGLRWLKQVFNRETKAKARRAYQLLILDGHGSHVTKEFI